MAFPHCPLGWTASPGAEHLQGKCPVFWYSLPLQSPGHSSSTAGQQWKIQMRVTHLRQSTFLFKSLSSSKLVSRVTAVKHFHSQFFMQHFSNSPSSILLFPHCPFLINVSEFSEPFWSCWTSDRPLWPPLTKYLTGFVYFNSMSAHAF